MNVEFIEKMSSKYKQYSKVKIKLKSFSLFYTSKIWK